MNEERITKEDFLSYVEVQESGVTNMMNVSLVSQLTGLDKEDLIYIMSNYRVLYDRYNENN